MAYGASTGINLESGHIYLTLYRVCVLAVDVVCDGEADNPQSPNSYLAFQQGAKVIKGLTDGSVSNQILACRETVPKSSGRMI